MTSPRPGQSSSAPRASAGHPGRGLTLNSVSKRSLHTCARRPVPSALATRDLRFGELARGGRCGQGALRGESALRAPGLAARSRGRSCEGGKRGTAPGVTARRIRHPCASALSLHPPCPFLILAYSPGWPRLGRVSYNFGAVVDFFSVGRDAAGGSARARAGQAETVPISL